MGVRPLAALLGTLSSALPRVMDVARAAHGVGRLAHHVAVVERSWARKILGLPLSVTPCCVVPLGWPRGRYGPTTRKPVEQVVHLDTYGNRAWLDT